MFGRTYIFADFRPRCTFLCEISGLAPDTIDTVVLTHLHPDHFWGVTDANNSALIFPNADYVVSQPELAFWDSLELPGVPADDFRRMVLDTTRAHLERIRDRIRTAAATAEACRGVTFVPTPGHTPGHVSVVVESEGETLLVSGDVITNALVSLEKPNWAYVFDFDADQAIASRRTFLDQAASERHRVFGYHTPWPGLGYVTREAGAHRWIQEEWIW